MKVVFITRSMEAGGAERVIAQLVKYMTEKKTECAIITLNNGPAAYELPAATVLHAIGKVSQNRRLDKILKYGEVRRLVQAIKPDIVLAMPEEIGIFVIPALWGTGIPVIISERNNPRVMPWRKGSRLFRRLMYPFATGFVFQTDQARDFFPLHIRNKSIVLPNPLDLGRLPKPFCGAKRNEIVGVGRMNKQKNFPLLIRAFALFYENHPDYVLTIYGEGELQEELEKLARGLLPEAAVSFPGVTSELLEKIRGAAMFVLSSDYEGMPNVVIEAMAMGVPVISTDCPSGGPGALIKDGSNGLLVPVGDEIALSAAMARLADSKVLPEALGKNASNIGKELDVKIVGKNWMSYLNQHCLD
ncbi:glycosyltransferase [Acetobacterium bakii]|uniref:Glycosyl transferase family 1 n=1 Tax=Acetobacterium bakii TaxID=52689 RepID=A0A0L6U0J5_9FIRM|nr:glycosyltransferase [Acetobacterium bakii]KNZ42034.1 hypothetical protein AKG39_08845 [Acetobacterium bakii]